MAAYVLQHRVGMSIQKQSFQTSVKYFSSKKMKLLFLETSKAYLIILGFYFTPGIFFLDI